MGLEKPARFASKREFPEDEIENAPGPFPRSFHGKIQNRSHGERGSHGALFSARHSNPGGRTQPEPKHARIAGNRSEIGPLGLVLNQASE